MAPDIEEIQRENHAAFVGREMWAIIDEPDGTFSVYWQNAASVGPKTSYNSKRQAVARLLQLIGTGPVAPQTWPESIYTLHDRDRQDLRDPRASQQRDVGERRHNAAAGRDASAVSGYYGHKTLHDGTRVPLTEAEAKQLWEDMERSRAERAARLPDERSALLAMFDAYDRLKELGWREAIYCPKDGSTFQVIEAGSTGVHCAHYDGEWPKGRWWIHDADGDLSPSRPILFKLYPEDQAKEDARA